MPVKAITKQVKAIAKRRYAITKQVKAITKRRYAITKQVKAITTCRKAITKCRYAIAMWVKGYSAFASKRKCATARRWSLARFSLGVVCVTCAGCSR